MYVGLKCVRNCYAFLGEIVSLVDSVEVDIKGEVLTDEDNKIKKKTVELHGNLHDEDLHI